MFLINAIKIALIMSIVYLYLTSSLILVILLLSIKFLCYYMNRLFWYFYIRQIIYL